MLWKLEVYDYDCENFLASLALLLENAEMKEAHSYDGL